MKWLMDLLTERDNQTFDLKRVGWAGALFFAIGCKAYDLIGRHGALDFGATCEGLAVILGAGGVAIALNGKTEREG